LERKGGKIFRHGSWPGKRFPNFRGKGGPVCTLKGEKGEKEEGEEEGGETDLFHRLCETSKNVFISVRDSLREKGPVLAGLG